MGSMKITPTFSAIIPLEAAGKIRWQKPPCKTRERCAAGPPQEGDRSKARAERTASGEA